MWELSDEFNSELGEENNQKILWKRLSRPKNEEKKDEKYRKEYKTIGLQGSTVIGEIKSP